MWHHSRLSTQSTLWGKKTAPFYFCNNFVKSFFFWIIIGTQCNIYLINLEQNDIKIIDLIWRVSLYCLVKCNIRITSLLSRKLKRHRYFLEHLNETSYKVWKCTDQQRSAIVKHIIKISSCLPMSPTYVISLHRYWILINHLINDRLLDAWPTVIRMSPQLINISHRILIDPLL